MAHRCLACGGELAGAILAVGQLMRTYAAFAALGILVLTGR